MRHGWDMDGPLQGVVVIDLAILKWWNKGLSGSWLGIQGKIINIQTRHLLYSGHWLSFINWYGLFVRQSLHRNKCSNDVISSLMRSVTQSPKIFGYFGVVFGVPNNFYLSDSMRWGPYLQIFLLLKLKLSQIPYPVAHSWNISTLEGPGSNSCG